MPEEEEDLQLHAGRLHGPAQAVEEGQPWVRRVLGHGYYDTATQEQVSHISCLISDRALGLIQSATGLAGERVHWMLQG